MSKRRVEDLAVFGGVPAFREPLHVGRPNIGSRDRLLARLTEALDRHRLTNDGPFVRQLEEQLAALVGVRHCLAICNATVALEIVLKAAGLSGEVIVPSFTFVATAHAVMWQGLTPVFCDVDPRTHTLDPRQVERLITPRTSGIIGVHVWGRPCSVEALDHIARRRGLVLLFDAAHAIGCSHRGRMIGGFGRAEILSFHATKVLQSFEGGAVVTDDDELASRVRLMRNFGFDGLDNVVSLGTNGKMSEAAAAMGLTSLESFDDFVAANRWNYARYAERLGGLPGVQLVAYDPRERSNYQYAVLEIDESEAGLSRDRLVSVLRAENVLARRYFYPGCHRMEPYRTLFPGAGQLLPHTERLAAHVLALPSGTAVGSDEVDAVSEIVRFTLSRAEEVSHRLHARSA